MSQLFDEFCQCIAKLRDPKDGCPWMLAQTHTSLQKYMLEEAYEAVEQMTDPPQDALAEELGDVLLQVILHSQIAQETGHFTIDDVLLAIYEKMVRRHPHVFKKKQQGDTAALTWEQIQTNWQRIKKEEKQAQGLKENDQDLWWQRSWAKEFPALKQAQKIGEKTAEIGFDWPQVEDVIKQLESEIKELKQALKERALGGKQLDEGVACEIADLFFTLAQLCRHLNCDAEVMALKGNQKFLKRFAQMKKIMAKKGFSLENKAHAPEVWEQFWKQAKSEETNET